MWSMQTNPQLNIRHCRDETAIQLDELCGRNSFKYNGSREGNISSTVGKGLTVHISDSFTVPHLGEQSIRKISRNNRYHTNLHSSNYSLIIEKYC